MSRKTLSHNAEVTLTGINRKGTSAGKQKPVVVKATPVGKFKQNVNYLCLTTLGISCAVGLAMDWSSDMVHVAYPLAGVYIVGMLNTFLTKME